MTDRPSLISVKTVIGYGMPTAGTRKAHSDAPGEEAVRETKRQLGWPEDKHFYIPEEALAHFREAMERGAQQEQEWNALVERYEQAHADLGAAWRTTMSGELPEGWEDTAAVVRGREADGDARRLRRSHQRARPAHAHAHRRLGRPRPLDQHGHQRRRELPGGELTKAASLHFGVREHAMGATLTGISLNGGLIPYGGTFMCFSDYMKPAIRLAALSEVQVIYVFTHDSIGLGEDGPTHQPIEHLAGLRAIPHLYVIRPADPHETREAWRIAIKRRKAPTALVLTRQKVPVLDQTKLRPGRGRAARRLHSRRSRSGRREQEGRARTHPHRHGLGSLARAGSARRLQKEGTPTRVVSMPCWELFEEQPKEYRDEVLPPDVTARLSIEAGARLGWDRYVGSQGDCVSIDRFGASAPGDVALRNWLQRRERRARAPALLLGRSAAMRIAVAADHAGFPLNERVIEELRAAGHEIEDFGTHDGSLPDDYPDYALALGRAVQSGAAEIGILICGSGVGASVAANKLRGVRAALCADTYSARQSREHDDCNVLCLGARVVGSELAMELVRAFVAARFNGEERHRRRLAKINDIERLRDEA